MENQYCISMQNVKRRKLEHTLPLILAKETNHYMEDEPAVFSSQKQAIEIARSYKQLHPEINFEIRYYWGKAKYAYEMFSPDGALWKISKNVLTVI